MKTVVIIFPISYAERVAKLLYSLELKILMTWCSEGDLFSDGTINCILKLNGDKSAITPELQLEKIRENSFIKIKG